MIEISNNNIRNEEIDIDESSLNKTKFRTINKDGILELITELEKLILKNGNNNEDLDYLNESNTDMDIFLSNLTQNKCSDFFPFKSYSTI